MNALVVATKLDWNGWIRGLFGALISGGAGAVGAGFGASILDPGHDLVGGRLLALIGSSFLFSGIVSLAKYLQMHPVPEEKPQPADDKLSGA
jgi:hypothetical protein